MFKEIKKQYLKSQEDLDKTRRNISENEKEIQFRRQGSREGGL